MSDTAVKSKMHYAWVIAFVGFVIYWFAICIVSNCVGMFVTPVSEAMGISRSAFTLNTTCVSVTSMITSMFIGKLYKKFSIRKVMLIGSIVMPAAYACFSIAPNIYAFYAVSLVLGTCLCAVAQVGVSTLISSWFNEKRGLAIAIAATGSGIGGIIMNPLIASLITNLGYRKTYLVLAIMMACTLIPCALFLVKSTPADKGLEPYGGAPEAGGIDLQHEGMTAAEARKTPIFWMWVAICMVISASCVCIMQHTTSYITDLGHPYAFAAKIASIVTASLAVGKLVMGVVFDKLGTHKAATISITIFIAALTLYCFAENTVALYVGPAIIGFGLSFSTVAYSVVTQDLFGKLDFASIYGTLVIFTSLGSAVGSPIVAGVYDTMGTYRPAWMVMTGLQVCCLILLQVIFAQKKKLAHDTATRE